MYQDSAHAYFRSAVHIGMRQHLSRRGALEFPGGLLLWKAVGKVLLVLVPAVVAAHLLFSSFVSNAEESVRAADDHHYNLTIANSLLKSERSRLLTPEQVRALVGDSYSLHAPEKGQVRVFNRTTGQFRYL